MKTRLFNIFIICATLFCGSCSMIQDDFDDCPSGLYVRFVYDYNTLRSDMFNDHVGHVRLYVYNESGQLVAERTVSNSAALAPLRNRSHYIHFTSGELPQGQYRLQAIAMQRDWDEALGTSGAKYRFDNHRQSHTLTVDLDRDSQTLPGTNLHPVSDIAPLDTLWHTLRVTADIPCDGTDMPSPHITRPPYCVQLPEQFVTVADGYATHATVSLVRDTKHLNITLRQLDDPADINHNDYEITIVDNNSTLAHDNSVVAGDSLIYTPYAQWTTRFDENGVQIERSSTQPVQRTAHYNIMFNRLMHPSDPNATAKLRIRNRKTGNTVALINLPHTLAEGRNAFELGYNPQEYLDREHDYHLDLFLRGDTWQYCNIVVNVMSWSHRIDNITL